VREGDRFDHYVVKEKIASGGMADIFRAERVGAMDISREVCIKVIRAAFCSDAEFVQMFIDEARISSRLRHSNIVAIDHFGSIDGSLFMCMEWVHGTDASRLLKRLVTLRRALPVDAAVFIVAEVLKALEYAHAKTDERGVWLEIVHRDVTPHNVMVSYAGEVKLSDFGIAKATSRLHQTQGDVIKGKIAYMAPEQAMGGALDRRTDLFAVGVMAFELLAGRRPFPGADATEGVQAMLRGERAALRRLRPEVPVAVEAVIDKLLALRADERYDDATAARDAIDAIPGLGGGHRTLQRLLRELYAEEQHSTLLPRFGAEAPREGATEPMRSFASISGVTEPTPHTTDTTLPAGPTARGARTLTAGPQEPLEPTLASTPVPVAVAVPRLPEPPAAAPRSPRWPLALAGVVFAAAGVVLAVAVTVARRPVETRPAASVAAPRPEAPTPTPGATPTPAAPPPVAPAALPDAAATVADAAAPEAPAEEGHATLSVVAIPWGQITVNGRTEENRGTFRLRPGRYRVEAEQPGIARKRRTVRLRAGDTETLRINMLEE
jgi:serine/threonine protein kinase